MAAERRGNVSPHCCGCSTRVMYENLPPDHTAVQPATTTAASTVRSAPAGSAREEEVDQSRATSDGGGADDGQRRRRHRTPKGPGPVSAVRSAPTHSKLGRRVTRDTTPGCVGPSATRRCGFGGGRVPVCSVHCPTVSHVENTPWDALSRLRGRAGLPKPTKSSPRRRWGRFLV